jgi:hypothetical protein
MESAATRSEFAEFGVKTCERRGNTNSAFLCYFYAHQSRHPKQKVDNNTPLLFKYWAFAYRTSVQCAERRYIVLCSITGDEMN